MIGVIVDPLGGFEIGAGLRGAELIRTLVSGDAEFVIGEALTGEAAVERVGVTGALTGVAGTGSVDAGDAVAG